VKLKLVVWQSSNVPPVKLKQQELPNSNEFKEKRLHALSKNVWLGKMLRVLKLLEWQSNNAFKEKQQRVLSKSVWQEKRLPAGQSRNV
jgi:hypothetical protein